MHEEELELTDVVDKESLVAGRHHVAGLLVGSVTDLFVLERHRSASSILCKKKTRSHRSVAIGGQTPVRYCQVRCRPPLFDGVWKG